MTIDYAGGSQNFNEGAGAMPAWYQALVNSGALRGNQAGQAVTQNLTESQLQSLIGQPIGTFQPDGSFQSDLFGRVGTTPQTMRGQPAGPNRMQDDSGGPPPGMVAYGNAGDYYDPNGNRQIHVGNLGDTGQNSDSRLIVDSQGRLQGITSRDPQDDIRVRNMGLAAVAGVAGVGAAAGAFGAAGGASGASGGAAAGGGSAAGGSTAAGGTFNGITAGGGAAGSGSGIGGGAAGSGLTYGGAGGTTAGGAAASASPYSLTAGQAAGGATTAGGMSGMGGGVGGSAPAASNGGGWTDALGSAVSGTDWGGLIGAGLGAYGSYVSARNQPTTLTTTTTSNGTQSGSQSSSMNQSTRSGVDSRYQGGIDSYLGRAYSAPTTNSNIETGAGMIGKTAADQSLMNGAIGANQGFMADGGRNAYSGSNPYMDTMINRGVDDITRGYTQMGQTNDARLARGNAFGGSAWLQQSENTNRQAGDAIGQYVNNARFADYQMQAGLDESRLGRQQNAIGMAPGLEAGRYVGGQALAGVGQQQIGNQYASIGLAGQAAGLAGNIGATSDVSGSSSGTSTSTSSGTNTQTGNNPYAQNPYAAAIGGALGGYQIGSAVTQPQQQSAPRSNINYTQLGSPYAMGGA